MSSAAASNAGLPQLQLRHGATQLIVDGKPFAILGGELNNSSASSQTFMKTTWPKLQAMRFNTVLAPVYWEFIEPHEGKFNFESVDGLIVNARKHNMRLAVC